MEDQTTKRVYDRVEKVIAESARIDTIDGTIMFMHPAGRRDVTIASGSYTPVLTEALALFDILLFAAYHPNQSVNPPVEVYGASIKHPDDGMPYDAEIGERFALARALQSVPKDVRRRFWLAFKKRWPKSPVGLTNGKAKGLIRNYYDYAQARANGLIDGR